MPKSALIYAWSIVALGCAGAATSVMLWQTSNATAFWTCLALAALASTFKIKLPGFDSCISPSFVFVLVAAAQFNGPETVVLAMASGLVQSLWKRSGKFSFVQVAFNVSALAISSGLAFGMAHSKQSSGMGNTLLLGVAGVVLLVVNTLIVSVVLCLVQAASIRAVWNSVQFWAFPYYLAGGVLASVWVHSLQRPGAMLAVLAAVSVYVLSVCYRQAMERWNGVNAVSC